MARKLIKNILRTAFSSADSSGTNWVVVFVSFLLAVTLWFLVTLNRDYQTTYSIPAKIVDIPDNVQLMEEASLPLEITAKGVGIDLLTEHLRFVQDTLPLAFPKRKGQTFLLTRDFRSDLSDYLNKRITLLEIRPDSIKIPYELRTQKTVPLTSRIRVRLTPSFIADTIIVERPDSVTLVGAKSLLDSIQVWHTAAIELVAEDYPRRYWVPIDTFHGLKVSPKEAVIYLHPRQYTQKTLEVRLEMKGVPDNLIVNLNPARIQLSCLVPLEDYDHIYGPYVLPLYYDSLDQQLPYFLPPVGRVLPKEVKVVWSNPLEVTYVIVEKPQ